MEGTSSDGAMKLKQQNSASTQGHSLGSSAALLWKCATQSPLLHPYQEATLTGKENRGRNGISSEIFAMRVIKTLDILYACSEITHVCLWPIR